MSETKKLKAQIRKYKRSTMWALITGVIAWVIYGMVKLYLSQILIIGMKEKYEENSHFISINQPSFHWLQCYNCSTGSGYKQYSEKWHGVKTTEKVQGYKPYVPKGAYMYQMKFIHKTPIKNRNIFKIAVSRHSLSMAIYDSWTLLDRFKK